MSLNPADSTQDYFPERGALRSKLRKIEDYFSSRLKKNIACDPEIFKEYCQLLQQEIDLGYKTKRKIDLIKKLDKEIGTLSQKLGISEFSEDELFGDEPSWEPLNSSEKVLEATHALSDTSATTSPQTEDFYDEIFSEPLNNSIDSLESLLKNTNDLIDRPAPEDKKDIARRITDLETYSQKLIEHSIQEGLQLEVEEAPRHLSQEQQANRSQIQEKLEEIEFLTEVFGLKILEAPVLEDHELFDDTDIVSDDGFLGDQDKDSSIQTLAPSLSDSELFNESFPEEHAHDHHNHGAEDPAIDEIYQNLSKIRAYLLPPTKDFDLKLFQNLTETLANLFSDHAANEIIVDHTQMGLQYSHIAMGVQSLTPKELAYYQQETETALDLLNEKEKTTEIEDLVRRLNNLNKLFKTLLEANKTHLKTLLDSAPSLPERRKNGLKSLAQSQQIIALAQCLPKFYRPDQYHDNSQLQLENMSWSLLQAEEHQTEDSQSPSGSNSGNPAQMQQPQTENEQPQSESTSRTPQNIKKISDSPKGPAKTRSEAIHAASPSRTLRLKKKSQQTEPSASDSPASLPHASIASDSTQAIRLAKPRHLRNPAISENITFRMTIPTQFKSTIVPLPSPRFPSEENSTDSDWLSLESPGFPSQDYSLPEASQYELSPALSFNNLARLPTAKNPGDQDDNLLLVQHLLQPKDAFIGIAPSAQDVLPVASPQQASPNQDFEGDGEPVLQLPVPGEERIAASHSDGVNLTGGDPDQQVGVQDERNDESNRRPEASLPENTVAAFPQTIQKNSDEVDTHAVGQTPPVDRVSPATNQDAAQNTHQPSAPSSSTSTSTHGSNPTDDKGKKKVRLRGDKIVVFNKNSTLSDQTIVTVPPGNSSPRSALRKANTVLTPQSPQETPQAHSWRLWFFVGAIELCAATMGALLAPKMFQRTSLHSLVSSSSPFASIGLRFEHLVGAAIEMALVTMLLLIIYRYHAHTPKSGSSGTSRAKDDGVRRSP